MSAVGSPGGISGATFRSYPLACEIIGSCHTVLLSSSQMLVWQVKLREDWGSVSSAQW